MTYFQSASLLITCMFLSAGFSCMGGTWYVAGFKDFARGLLVVAASIAGVGFMQHGVFNAIRTFNEFFPNGISAQVERLNIPAKLPAEESSGSIFNPLMF